MHFPALSSYRPVSWSGPPNLRSAGGSCTPCPSSCFWGLSGSTGPWQWPRPTRALSLLRQQCFLLPLCRVSRDRGQVQQAQSHAGFHERVDGGEARIPGEVAVLLQRVETLHKPGQGCMAPTSVPHTVIVVAEGTGLTLTQSPAARTRGRSGSTSFPGTGPCVAGQLCAQDISTRRVCAVYLAA